MTDIDAVRRQFPGLADGTVRLDGPAAAQTAQPVLDAMVDYLRTDNANLGACFRHSVSTSELLAEARRRAAAFLGAEAAEVGFGLNATALNLELARTATTRMRPGDEIVVTALDHDANLAPWTRAAAERDLVLRTVDLRADTRVDLAGIAAAIGDRTRIVAFPYANNALGTLVEVAEVARLAHSVGALAWADATHWAPHGPIHARANGVDVVVCSAYKFFGPHLGLCYARREVVETWPADQLQDASGMGRFEHGTLPFESLAGLIGALDYLDQVGWDFITAHELGLGNRLLAGLPDRWRLHGLPTMDGRTATFALTLPGRSPDALARQLAEHGIAVGAGEFNAHPAMSSLGLADGAIRLGFLHYNTIEEVDTTLAVLGRLSHP